MKRTTIIIVLLVMSVTAFGQGADSLSAITSDGCLRTYISKNVRLGRTLTVDTTIGHDIEFFRSKSDGVETILKYNYNGDLYFLPSAFCNCDSCKNFKGMKYYGNLFKIK